MRYRLDTTAGIQDMYELRLYELNHTPWGKKYEKRYRLTMLARFGIALLAGYLVYLNLYLYFESFVIYAAIILLGAGIWQLLAKRHMRRNILRQLRREEKLIGFSSSEMFFYDDGFSDVLEDVKFDVQYRHVKQAVLYKNSYFFLRTMRLSCIIPCRCLAGQATIPEFADFLRSRGITLETVE